jgi:hypothetical protein
MAEAFIIIFLLTVATRGLIQQTKRDLAAWRHRPPPSRGDSWWTRPITAGGTGYWGHQALHGFPSARHGLADGWHRAHQAHQSAREEMARRRAERAEGKAELHPQLETYRQRRAAALQRLWDQQRHQPEETAEPAATPDSVVAGPEVRQCYEHGNPLPCGLCDADAQPGKGTRYEHAHCTGCGTWYLAGHGPGCWVGAAEAAERVNTPTPGWQSEETGERLLSPPDDEPEPGDERYQQEAEDIRAGFGFENCELCDQGLDGHDIRPDALGHAHAYCKEQDPPEPDQAPGTSERKGDEIVSETTYQAVKARMTAAQAAAEQRQAEAASARDGTEERVEEAQAAQAYAETTGEEMQALHVDAGTLNAMAEHQDALRKTVEAEQALQEAATAVNTAWQDVVETAGTVSQQLEASGHGQLDEAHANAAAGGAEKQFYGEG